MESLRAFFSDLNTYYLIRAGLTLIVVLLFLLLRYIVRRSINKIAERFGYELHRSAMTKRVYIFTLYVVALFLIITIWGANFDNIWFYLSSVLGVIAIGFFAIWSILSNVVAGILIYSLNPFKIGDKLNLIEKNIEAEVMDIGLIYTVLQDDEYTFRIPNNIFFQQVFKVKKQELARRRKTN
jgi:MscS family membrane protein